MKTTLNNEEHIKYSIEFYTQMFCIRKMEELILDIFEKGLVRGTVHTCIGQEACAVGVINALDREKDIIFSNHRSHGHFISYSHNLTGLLGEIMGKEIGVCKGLGGSQHLHFKNFYSNGIQGGIVPVAAGMALAEKIKKSGAIAVVFLGDGTLGQGVVYESLNVSSLWKLPILFVVENNRYAQSTPFEMQHSGTISSRAETFQIFSDEIIVEDVELVYQAAQKAVRFIREGNGPFFLMLHTYRFSPHSKRDDFRSKDEIELFKKKDPLMKLRQELEKLNINLLKIEKEIADEIADALKTAEKSSSMKLDVYLKTLPQKII